MAKTVSTRLFLAAITVAAVTPMAVAQLQMDVQPKKLADLQVAQVVLTASLPNDVSEATIELQPPHGFKVDQNPIRIAGAPARKIVRSVFLQASDLGTDSGTQTLSAELWSTGSTPRKLLGDTQRQTIAYANSRISIGEFFAYAFLGIVLGYIVRLLIKVLGAIPPPAAAPPLAGPIPGGPVPTATEGPITQFVKRHYYLVDCAVTAILGLLILAAMLRSGRVPDTAAQWYSALIAGTGLGLLTNSELLTKFPKG